MANCITGHNRLRRI
nr:unnamed protein product [Callosobruchus chinensis]